MKMKAGLWIDHRKAVVVSVTDKGSELVLVLSAVEKHPAAPSFHARKAVSSRSASRRMKRRGLDGHIVGIESVDKMTDGQIAAKVKQRFTE